MAALMVLWQKTTRPPDFYKPCKDVMKNQATLILMIIEQDLTIMHTTIIVTLIVCLQLTTTIVTYNVFL